MIIKPLSQQPVPNKPWAIVTKAGAQGIEMVDNMGQVYRRRRGLHSRQALAGINGPVFSAVKATSLLIATDARYWSAKTWNGALMGLKMDGGPKITPFSRVFKGQASPMEMVETLTHLENILKGYNVKLGSLSSMAWNLWRSTLDRPVTIYGPNIRDALYGGRKEALFPGEYKAVNYWDISAAYPNAQAEEDYPLRLKEVSATSDISEGSGIAYASVNIPELPWGPLPVRISELATCYGWGKAEGWWTWRDLRTAKSVGVDVAIIASFAGLKPVNLFGAWWNEMAQYRKLSGFTGKMIKAITSTLWGQFALSQPDTEIVRWTDEWSKHRITVPERPRNVPHRFMVHIAAETTARVREKLWREGLSLNGSMYCDTDAVMTGKSVQPTGNNWSIKHEMVQVDIRGPQTYRHRCSNCGIDHPDWHYVVGGIGSPEAAERVFRREHRRHFIPLTGNFDGLALPAMEIQQAKEVIRWSKI